MSWVRYGVAEWQLLYRNFLRSLRIVSEMRILLELRGPVTRTPVGWNSKVFEDVAEAVSRGGKPYVVFNRLFGRPVVDPRDSAWCEKYCVSDEEFEAYVKELQKIIPALRKA